MIISQDTNGTPMIIGTIEATPATPSPPPPLSAANTMTTSPVPPQQTRNVATSTASGTIVQIHPVHLSMVKSMAIPPPPRNIISIESNNDGYANLFLECDNGAQA